MSFSEVILLNNGNQLEGELLKKTETQLFLDVGFDVLRIPSDAVKEVQADSSTTSETPVESASENTNAHLGAQLYSGASDRKTRTVKENAERVGEAVVQVRTPSGLGSGFVIHPQGYIITNNHVISGEHKITIIFFKKTARELEKVQKQNVRIVATSPVLDLALVKIEGEDDEETEYPYVPIGASQDVRSGQTVFAIGSPLGLGRSVSQGIVSVRNRVMTGGLVYVQHTAQINPGNSGGPLFNLQGEVVGVLNMKLASVGVEGMGFAIPASLIKLFLDNQDAYAFDPRHPNAGFRYLDPPGAEDRSEEDSADPVTTQPEPEEESPSASTRS